jgi:cytoskeletal protein RodZ
MRAKLTGGQDGSLAGFIIIGVLLALVLVGGLYGLNRYNTQKASEEVATKDQATRTSETKQEDTSKTEQTPKLDDKAAEERSESKTKVTAPRTSQDTAQTNQPPAATPTPASNSTSTHLPQTGPADTLVSLFVIGALTFASIYYVRSLQA